VKTKTLKKQKIRKLIDKLNLREIINLDFFIQNSLDVFLVGGLIRDTFLKPDIPLTLDLKKQLDVDIVVDIKDINNIKLYKNYVEELSKKYKLVLLDSEKLIYRVVIDENIIIDLTYTFDIKKDFLRRDFTINSIYYNLLKDDFEDIKDNYISTSDCFEDIDKGILRPVEFKNLIDDPLRMLRAVRFKNYLNLSYHKDLFYFIEKNIYHLMKVNNVRVSQEIMKIFDISRAYLAVKDLIEMGFFKNYNVFISSPEKLILITKIFDFSYFLYKDILLNEYDMVIKSKSYYLALLLSMYLYKYSRGMLSDQPFYLILGDKTIKKAKKLLSEWNQRQNYKFLINNFKHKNNLNSFEFVFLNLVLDSFKLDDNQYFKTLSKLCKVCFYICELKKNIIPFDHFSTSFNTKNYEEYINYVVSNL